MSEAVLRGAQEHLAAPDTAGDTLLHLWAALFALYHLEYSRDSQAHILSAIDVLRERYAAMHSSDAEDDPYGEYVNSLDLNYRYVSEARERERRDEEERRSL